MRFRKGMMVFTVVVLLLLLSSGLIYAAGATAVNNGSATVDGVVGADEWDVTSPPPPDGTGDFVANLYHSGQTVDNTVLGKLYLQYTCVDGGPNQLYALVRAEEGLTIFGPDDPGEHYIKYRSPSMNTFTKAVDNTDTTNFVFVGSPETGWEAVAELPENEYELDVHTNILYDGGSQTAATIDLRVSLACGPTAVSMAGVTAAAGSAGGSALLVGVAFLTVATMMVVRRRES